MADLSYSNWVSDLTSLPLASLLLLSDKTMCGQRTPCVCVVDEITVFSYQNEMTKRGCVTLCVKCLRGWVYWQGHSGQKGDRNTLGTL